MRSRNGVTALLLGVLMLLPIFDLKKSAAATQNSAPTVVYMDKTSRGFAYTVKPKPKGYAPEDNLLRILDLVKEERGSNSPVIVLVDPRVPITEIWNFDGVAGKAQLMNVHYFVFNREAKRMSELKWGPSLPLSTNPPLK